MMKWHSRAIWLVLRRLLGPKQKEAEEEEKKPLAVVWTMSPGVVDWVYHLRVTRGLSWRALGGLFAGRPERMEEFGGGALPDGLDDLGRVLCERAAAMQGQDYLAPPWYEDVSQRDRRRSYGPPR